MDQTKSKGVSQIIEFEGPERNVRVKTKTKEARQKVEGIYEKWKVQTKSGEAR